MTYIRHFISVLFLSSSVMASDSVDYLTETAPTLLRPGMLVFSKKNKKKHTSSLRILDLNNTPIFEKTIPLLSIINVALGGDQTLWVHGYDAHRKQSIVSIQGERISEPKNYGFDSISQIIPSSNGCLYVRGQHPKHKNRLILSHIYHDTVSDPIPDSTQRALAMDGSLYIKGGNWGKVKLTHVDKNTISDIPIDDLNTIYSIDTTPNGLVYVYGETQNSEEFILCIMGNIMSKRIILPRFYSITGTFSDSSLLIAPQQYRRMNHPSLYRFYGETLVGPIAFDLHTIKSVYNKSPDIIYISGLDFHNNESVAYVTKDYVSKPIPVSMPLMPRADYKISSLDGFLYFFYSPKTDFGQFVFIKEDTISKPIPYELCKMSKRDDSFPDGSIIIHGYTKDQQKAIIRIKAGVPSSPITFPNKKGPFQFFLGPDESLYTKNMDVVWRAAPGQTTFTRINDINEIFELPSYPHSITSHLNEFTQTYMTQEEPLWKDATHQTFQEMMHTINMRHLLTLRTEEAQALYDFILKHQDHLLRHEASKHTVISFLEHARTEDQSPLYAYAMALNFELLCLEGDLYTYKEGTSQEALLHQKSAEDYKARLNATQDALPLLKEITAHSQPGLETYAHLREWVEAALHVLGEDGL